MILIDPSNEQIDIINNLKVNNIIVDSVAGCGKTTTNLHIAKQYNQLKILLLTYNTRLKLDTREKVNKLNLTNLEVHSYHSFCVKYLNNKCFTDDGIINILKKNVEPIQNINYDILILDEAQDISPLYYELIIYIIKYNIIKNPKLCILGDRYQSIYDFNNADNRYIIYSDLLFNINNFNWNKKKLSTSFRLTAENANFINNCIIDQNRINSIKTGIKPRYIICDTFCYEKINFESPCYNEIKYYLNLGYLHEDIFVLAPSVKSNSSPIRQLANQISKSNIPIYVPNSDEEKIDEDIIKNKIVFSTFHQSKGLERKVVIVFNIDDSYFKYYKKNVNPYSCPNEIYVALTRSIDRLTCFHHYKNNYINFIKKDLLEKYCSFHPIYKLSINKSELKKNINTPVTGLINHLPIDIINKSLDFLNYNIINPKDIFIDIPIKTKQKSLCENVSDITGIAIPSYFEYINSGKMKILEKLLNSDNSMVNNYINDSDNDNNNNNDDIGFIDSNSENENENENEKDKYNLHDIDLNNLKPDELLYISNRWNTYISGYVYKINQITNYNWLSKDNLQLSINRLKKYISSNAIYEIEFKQENKKELSNRKLIGYIDCIDDNTIWEFKCVKELEKEHIIQLGCYMYLFLNYLEELNESNKINNEKILNKLNKELLKCKSDNKKDKLLFEIANLSSNYKEKKIEDYKFKLMNIFTEEIIEVSSTKNNIILFMEYIIDKKFFNSIKISDKEFIELNLKNLDKYITAM